jgi:hypothetical protein
MRKEDIMLREIKRIYLALRVIVISIFILFTSSLYAVRCYYSRQQESKEYQRRDSDWRGLQMGSQDTGRLRKQTISEERKKGWGK